MYTVLAKKARQCGFAESDLAAQATEEDDRDSLRKDLDSI
jgi:hypothetical protein